MRHLRCVVLCENRVLYLTEIIVLVLQTVIYTSPQLLLSRKCAMAALGPMSPSLITESIWLQIRQLAIWYSLSKPATIHPTSLSSHCES
jgi:hypothetical protein